MASQAILGSDWRLRNSFLWLIRSGSLCCTGPLSNGAHLLGLSSKAKLSSGWAGAILGAPVCLHWPHCRLKYALRPVHWRRRLLRLLESRRRGQRSLSIQNLRLPLPRPLIHPFWRLTCKNIWNRAVVMTCLHSKSPFHWKDPIPVTLESGSSRKLRAHVPIDSLLAFC